MSRVIVVGSVNADRFVRCPTLPGPGETVLARERAEAFGGKGGNQAAAAARMGAPTWLVAAVGDDAAGGAALADLDSFGVHVDHVRRLAAVPTGEALIMLDDYGQNMIIVVPGANARLTAHDVTTALADLAPHADDVVLTSAEVSEECARAAARACASVGARLIYNIAPARPLGSWVRLARTTVVVNEVEAAQITGAANGADAVLAASADSVVLTRGARGVRLLHGSTAVDLPAPAVAVVDTTGAGDAFCGGLAADLARGEPLERAVATATRVGSLAVTAVGARAALPTRDVLAASAS